MQVRFSAAADAARGVRRRVGQVSASPSVACCSRRGRARFTGRHRPAPRGAGAHVLGELWFVAAAWGLSVPLIQPDRPAESGIFATGEARDHALPALMTGAVIAAGFTGWLTLGLVFAAAGAAARPAAHWDALSDDGAAGVTAAVAADSSTILAQKAGRSSGLREVTGPDPPRPPGRPVSPALRISVCRLGTRSAFGRAPGQPRPAPWPVADQPAACPTGRPLYE